MSLLSKDKKNEVKKAIDSGDTSKIKEVKKIVPLVEPVKSAGSAVPNSSRQPAAKTPDQKLHDAISKMDVQAAKDAVAQGAKLDEADKHRLGNEAGNHSADALEMLLAVSDIEDGVQARLLSSTLSDGHYKQKEKASNLLGSLKPEVQNLVLAKCMDHEKNSTLADWAAKAVKKLPKGQQHSMIGSCISSKWKAPRETGLEIALGLPSEQERLRVLEALLARENDGVSLVPLLRLAESCGLRFGSQKVDALIKRASSYFIPALDQDLKEFAGRPMERVMLLIWLANHDKSVRKMAISKMGILSDSQLQYAASLPYGDVKWAASKKQFKNFFW